MLEDDGRIDGSTGEVEPRHGAGGSSPRDGVHRVRREVIPPTEFRCRSPGEYGIGVPQPDGGDECREGALHRVRARKQRHELPRLHRVANWIVQLGVLAARYGPIFSDEPVEFCVHAHTSPEFSAQVKDDCLGCG